MWKRIVYFCSILIFFLFIGIYYGYNLVKINENKNYSIEKKDSKENIDYSIKASAEEDKIKLDTIINVKKIYNKCNHTNSEIKEVSEEIINMKEEEAREYFSDRGYLLLSFDSERIELLEEIKEERCKEHFVIKFGSSKDEFLSVYRLGEDEELSLYRETDIAKEFLTDIDNKNFEKGVDVYGKENVEIILEDYE